MAQDPVTLEFLSRKMDTLLDEIRAVKTTVTELNTHVIAMDHRLRAGDVASDGLRTLIHDTREDLTRRLDRIERIGNFAPEG